MTLTDKELWYRVEERRDANFNDDGDLLGYSTSVTVLTFPVLRHTATGVSLGMGNGTKKFVNASSKKAYARPSQAAAIKDFLSRKDRQIEILTAQIAVAQHARALAEEFLSRKAA